MLKKARRFFLRPKRVGIYEPPPPYGEVCADQPPNTERSNQAQIEELRQSIADLDLLAECSGLIDDESVHSELSDQDLKPNMGHKVSLLTGHKSKVSLTWVLREQSDIHNCLNNDYLDKNSASNKYDSDIIANDKEYYYDRNNCDRIIGRNTKQFQSYTDNLPKCKKNTHKYPDSWSESQDNYGCNKKYRHKKRRSRPAADKQENFGYQIKDIDSFLTEASIDSPGNIPVVVTYPSVLYQTQSGNHQREMSLPLGMVVNAVFKNQQWLYVQTPHGEEGYILYSSCLPLGILPTINKNQSGWKSTPCWESTQDLYPQPCGNMTDSEKEQLRGGTRSECGRRKYKHFDTMSAYSEKTFDKLYLKTTLNKLNDDENTYKHKDDYKLKYPVYKKRVKGVTQPRRHTLMVVESDYEGAKSVNTLTVKKGDVVILVQGESVEADVDCEWFYVRNRDGKEGFIPAAIAGHGYL